MNRNLGLLGTIGLGAGLMYVFDPDRGRRRRALLRDKVSHALNVTDEAMEKATYDLTQRARGMFAAPTVVLPRRPVADEVLAERVRSEMGWVVSHPSSIEIQVDGGRVTLSGPMLKREVRGLLRRLSRVPGVKAIENRLEVHERAGDVPGLQGRGRRRQPEFELMQENWAPGPRLVVSGAGGALAYIGLTRRDPMGVALGAVGVGLMARALTNVPLTRLMGLSGGRRAVDVRKTININAPLETVFDYWTRFENFPKFMSNVLEVRPLGDDRYHWKVNGPAGIPVEWDAAVTRREPNHILAWKSVGGSAIASAGVVRFDRNRDGSTRLDVRMSYNPPAGAVGHAVAAVFGADPKRSMDEDLMRFKSLIETGKTTARGEEVTSREALGHAGSG